MADELTVPVLGLNVDTNPLAAPKGSLALADNIVLRKPGSAEPARALANVATAETGRIANFTPDVNTYGVRLFCDGDTNVLAIERPTAGIASTDATKIRYSSDPTNEKGTVALGTGTRTLGFNNKRTQHAYTDGRHLVTSEAGVLVLDGVETSANQVPRLAGLVSPAAIRAGTAAVSTTYPQIVASGYVAYVAIFRRTVSGKYTLLSAPSRASIIGGGVAYGAVVTLTLSAVDPVLAGDELVIYRTATATSVAAIIPTYYESVSHTLTSAEIAALTVTVIDKTPEAVVTRGTELYTNDGQDGALAVNYLPPLARDVSVFAGSALYANVCSWPTLTLRVGTKFGVLAAGTDERTTGIGSRAFSGTHPALSNTISNISDANIVGLAVGQRVYDADSGSMRGNITAITYAAGANIVTLDSAFGPGSTHYVAYDQVTLTLSPSGTTVRVPVFLDSSIVVGDIALAGASVPGLRLRSDIGLGDLSATTQNAPSLAFISTVPGTCTSMQASSITNGANYTNTRASGGDFVCDSLQDTRKYTVWFGKPQQPEAVSPTSYISVGTQEVLRIVKVGTVALAFCTDGLWTIQGDAFNGFTTMHQDPKCVLFHPSAVAVLGNTAYALTYGGIVRVSDGTVQSISANAVDTLVRAELATWPERWDVSAVADPNNKEVRFAMPSGYTLVYNETTGAWSRRSDAMLHGCFDRGADATNRRDPDVLITTTGGYFSSGDTSAATALKHNPSTADAPATVKQFIDVNYLFEPGADGAFSLTFDGAVSRTVTTGPTVTAKEAHCRVPRRAARRPRLQPGFTTTAGTEFSYSGIRARFRKASDTVKR